MGARGAIITFRLKRYWSEAGSPTQGSLLFLISQVLIPPHEGGLSHQFGTPPPPLRASAAPGAILKGYSGPQPQRVQRLNTLASDKELSDFLKSVEKRAFKRTVYAVRDDDAALDIVQDAMIRLAEKYADRPAAELPLLFQRILSNATMDWFRRLKVRNSVLQNMSDFDTDQADGDFDLLEKIGRASCRERV